MKPLLFRVPTVDDRSFRVQVDQGPHFYERLHFHPEFQLTLIRESVGTQVIGDRIDRFRPYDVLLLGSNLPHVLRNDSEYFEPYSDRQALSFSVLFRYESVGKALFELPELGQINQLLREARHGIRLRCQTPNPLTDSLETLPHQRPFEQLMTLLNALDQLSAEPEREILSVTAYEQPRRPDDHQRLEHVFSFLLNHYAQPITLEDVANVAHLTPSAFCRFFRLHTRKTFSQLLNEIRTEHACRLLQESTLSIGQIAYSCGFTNLSNFNRQFKGITGLTPREYTRTLSP